MVRGALLFGQMITNRKTPRIEIRSSTQGSKNLTADIGVLLLIVHRLIHLLALCLIFAEAIDSSIIIRYTCLIKKSRRYFMTLTTKRILILSAIVLIGFVLGRLAVRALMNLLLGGTLFGGNIL